MVEVGLHTDHEHMQQMMKTLAACGMLAVHTSIHQNTWKLAATATGEECLAAGRGLEHTQVQSAYKVAGSLSHNAFPGSPVADFHERSYDTERYDTDYEITLGGSGEHLSRLWAGGNSTNA